MLSLYEILKASKTGIAPDMWTALAGMNWGGKDSGAEVKELTGIPPLSFTADGTPLLDYLISGNMEQSGTPTPTTPIQPQECGERTGNLLPLSDKTFTITTYGSNLTVTCSGGNLYFSGTVGEIPGSYTVWKTNFLFELEAGTYYCNNPSPLGSGFGRYIKKYSDDTTILGAIDYTFTLSETTKLYLAFYIYDKNFDNQVELMLNSGSTPLPYEPYGYKIPISSANTTTPVYLGEVQTTRKIKKLVLTGDNVTFLGDNERDGTIRFYSTSGTISSISDDVLCTHFEQKSRSDISGGNVIGTAIFNRTQIAFRIYTSIASTATEFNAWLRQQYSAGTPVTIWYVLANETTGIVNEPLRKIGDYADTVSYEQAGVQIPTNRGNTVIDVLTELKPSQMYIKYQE